MTSVRCHTGLDRDIGYGGEHKLFEVRREVTSTVGKNILWEGRVEMKGGKVDKKWYLVSSQEEPL